MPPKKAAVALANKLARIGWAVLRHQTSYCPAGQARRLKAQCPGAGGGLTSLPTHMTRLLGPSASAAQFSAGGLLDAGDEALREAFDLGVGQAALARLQHDRHGERFFALPEIVNIEQAGLGDELAIGA